MALNIEDIVNIGCMVSIVMSNLVEDRGTVIVEKVEDKVVEVAGNKSDLEDRVVVEEEEVVEMVQMVEGMVAELLADKVVELAEEVEVSVVEMVGAVEDMVAESLADMAGETKVPVVANLHNRRREIHWSTSDTTVNKPQFFAFFVKKSWKNEKNGQSTFAF